MKIALYSPLPPAKSGIADYSAALVSELAKIADVTTFEEKTSELERERFDIAVYQIGNNHYHGYCYETALESPGVVVIHEANLHHLIADLTIKRGDWDSYLREVEYDGGPAALEHAERARKLQVGPDYAGVPMLRRLLSRSKAAIVHSECVRGSLREAGFEGPIAKIPHGAWIPEADRNGYRSRLGLDEAAPLIGTFGFLKPYKRIAESLRAFRRLVRVQPNARMILVGEPHPEFRLHELIDRLDLHDQVRVLGFIPISDFVGYIAACDIVLNLRFPTVGENSGTLMRALGLGKAVLVSNVGSFCEYPDEICLKIPVDRTEEETLFEFLSLLTSRDDVRRELGNRARAWVAEECSWELAARRYRDFLEAVMNGAAGDWPPESSAVVAELPAGAEEPPVATAEDGKESPQPEGFETAGAPFESRSFLRDVTRDESGTPPRVTLDYIESWAINEPSREYIRTHGARLVKTLEMTPEGAADRRVLEMGAYLQITPALQTKLGYGEVRGCYYGPAGRVERREVHSSSGESFSCDVELFDAEKDRFPYDGEYFDTVLCCELLEHLFEDPMHMMSEINRILKPGGHLVLTTPNLCSARALSAILQGYHPGFFPAYIRPAAGSEEVDARHNREYTAREIPQLLNDAGFETRAIETGEFKDEPKPELLWIGHLLERYELPKELRGDGIYTVGRKTGPVRQRYPCWLYS